MKMFIFVLFLIIKDRNKMFNNLKGLDKDVFIVHC